MEKRTVTLLVAVLVGIIGLSLIGCAGGPTIRPQAKTMPELLTEAGFKAFPANVPYESEYMQKCPKNTLMTHTRGGTTVYCYVDQATNTMYHGDDAAYQRLQNLLQKRQQTVPEQRFQNDPLFWQMWESSRGLG